MGGRIRDPFGCPDSHVGMGFPCASKPGDEDAPASEGDERRCMALSEGPAITEYVFGPYGGRALEDTIGGHQDFVRLVRFVDSSVSHIVQSGPLRSNRQTTGLKGYARAGNFSLQDQESIPCLHLLRFVSA